ncbi:Uncharacterised protein [Bordetella pertussis]|nr:Uncharacterised protein [Bordetella pertussis]
MVSWPMRSAGVKGAFSTFSMDSRSGAYVRLADSVFSSE